MFTSVSNYRCQSTEVCTRTYSHEERSNQLQLLKTPVWVDHDGVWGLEKSGEEVSYCHNEPGLFDFNTASHSLSYKHNMEIHWSFWDVTFARVIQVSCVQTKPR